MSENKKKDVEVRLEDQQRICEFGVNTNELLEYKNKMKVIKNTLDGLEDAEQELMLMEDEVDVIKAKVGEVFIKMNEEELNEYIESIKIKSEIEETEINEKINGIQIIQDGLKKQLYSRFGDQINLEY